jgi:hypothetical protein
VVGHAKFRSAFHLRFGRRFSELDRVVGFGFGQNGFK